jgi:hypothetical protein
MSGRSVLGVDFTSAPRRAKPIVVARGRATTGAFMLEAIDPLPDCASFERQLGSPGPWIGGFDFPFGLPARYAISRPTSDALASLRSIGRARVPCA